MNNSKLVIDSVNLSLEEERNDQSDLQEREAKLTAIIEALKKIQATREWSTLKSHIFDGLEKDLERDLLRESQKDSPDLPKISKLAGQLKWAQRYADLGKLQMTYSAELINIKKLLYGTTKTQS